MDSLRRDGAGPRDLKRCVNWWRSLGNWAAVGSAPDGSPCFVIGEIRGTLIFSIRGRTGQGRMSTTSRSLVGGRFCRRQVQPICSVVQTTYYPKLQPDTTQKESATRGPTGARFVRWQRALEPDASQSDVATKEYAWGGQDLALHAAFGAGAGTRGQWREASKTDQAFLNNACSRAVSLRAGANLQTLPAGAVPPATRHDRDSRFRWSIDAK